MSERFSVCRCSVVTVRVLIPVFDTVEAAEEERLWSPSRDSVSVVLRLVLSERRDVCGGY